MTDDADRGLRDPAERPLTDAERLARLDDHHWMTANRRNYIWPCHDLRSLISERDQLRDRTVGLEAALRDAIGELHWAAIKFDTNDAPNAARIMHEDMDRARAVLEEP